MFVSCKQSQPQPLAAISDSFLQGPIHSYFRASTDSDYDGAADTHQPHPASSSAVYSAEAQTAAHDFLRRSESDSSSPSVSSESDDSVLERAYSGREVKEESTYQSMDTAARAEQLDQAASGLREASSAYSLRGYMSQQLPLRVAPSAPPVATLLPAPSGAADWSQLERQYEQYRLDWARAAAGGSSLMTASRASHAYSSTATRA